MMGTVEGIGQEDEIYARRFSAAEDAARDVTWKIVCRDFFQKYIRPQDTVIDLGACDGNFIRNIHAQRKIAVDLNQHVLRLKEFGIETVIASASDLSTVLGERMADVIFMSNFLEHMPDKRTLLAVLEQCRKCLKPGGKVLVLQPNIRFVGVAYWDYIDHHIALTEHSLVEALEVSGFTVEEVIPRFLPYTAKSVAGRMVGNGAGSWLIRLYVRLPILWRLFGAQTWAVGVKKS